MDGNSYLWEFEDASGAPNAGPFPRFNTDSDLSKNLVTTININNYSALPASGTTPAGPFRPWLINMKPNDIIYIRNRDEATFPNDFAYYLIQSTQNNTTYSIINVNPLLATNDPSSQFIVGQVYSIGYVSSGNTGPQGPTGEQGPTGADSTVTGPTGATGPVAKGDCFSEYLYWDPSGGPSGIWKVGGGPTDLNRVHIACEAGYIDPKR